MIKQTLQQLIAGCRKNKPDSQKKLYQHFYNYGMTICSRYANDREEAKDIFNDGFLKVLTKIDKYGGEQSFKAWVNKIIVNTAIDNYRKHQNKPKTVELVHVHSYETAPDAVQNLSAKEIMALVQQLPPAYRVAFNLYVVDGFTHPEIADKLGISVGTSKSNLAKARMKLKSMIAAQNQNLSSHAR